ncbi:class II glutamine amidotransferase [Phreatobacter aquaticus]|uniref:Class II glutamine amidotransferase n=2 Tax=Phreatobacter aquaticus TaxID=2570229 RepID=A0A4D7QTG7_9HYPH|nr:class II glutamine amidotransferase [Phreatobacter aquaticus]
MCELLGMSSSKPATLSLSLPRLAAHGGPPTLIRDGWGVAYYEGRDVRLIKDVGPADQSDWVRFVAAHDLRSTIVMAHIRKATMGEPAYRNAQPFARELAGRMHVFSHNGWMPEMLTSPRFRLGRFAPIGETDSEQAFCNLLERLQEVWSEPRAAPSLEARLSVVAAFASELRPLGPANFLYSDGDALFAHGDRRKQLPTQTVEPPGLVFLQRQCRFDENPSSQNGVVMASGDQMVSLVASVPLTDEQWQSFGQGDVIAFSGGRAVLRHSADEERAYPL